jgi:hypothetical protein
MKVRSRSISATLGTVARLLANPPDEPLRPAARVTAYTGLERPPTRRRRCLSSAGTHYAASGTHYAASFSSSSENALCTTIVVASPSP